MSKLLFVGGVIAFVIWLIRGNPRARAAMSAREAAKILEVDIDAEADAVQAAHRRMIARVHPDAGGSAELAARVNEARDILLRRKPQ